MTEYLKEYLNYRSGTLQAAIPEGCKLEHIQKLQLTSPTQEISGELAIVSGTGVQDLFQLRVKAVASIRSPVAGFSSVTSRLIVGLFEEQGRLLELNKLRTSSAGEKYHRSDRRRCAKFFAAPA